MAGTSGPFENTARSREVVQPCSYRWFGPLRVFSVGSQNVLSASSHSLYNRYGYNQPSAAVWQQTRVSLLLLPPPHPRLPPLPSPCSHSAAVTHWPSNSLSFFNPPALSLSPPFILCLSLNVCLLFFKASLVSMAYTGTHTQMDSSRVL